MTARSRTSALCSALALAAALCGCTADVAGTAVRPAPGIDEDSRSPVDVDAVLLDRSQLQAITGAGDDLTPVPGMRSKTPVDIDVLLGTVARQCQWVFAETQVFGPEVEEFHKSTYQSPQRGGLLSQAAAGYRDPQTAQAAFAELVARIHTCDQSRSGGALVGELSTTADSVRTRPGDCGRDYRIKSAVLVEVTFCAMPATVPDIVMANILANVPG
ncbi:MAG: sensor domain-containing protein [Actinomycetota bacterium]|nr:sensor domain-containing protein [Actinomycetota bacterium]